MSVPRHFHLIGIGGSAMAALAGMLKERGHHVTGSDTGVYPPASHQLAAQGIAYREGFSAENLEPRPDVVVVGNVIARGNAELEHALDAKMEYRSMAETLREEFLWEHTRLVVSGTHGKTTTSSMLAWILETAGRRPNYFIGGVAENFGRNYALGGGPEFVIEGDEYETAFFDRGPKFFHYRPEWLLLTSLEFDHVDNFPDLAALELQFSRLVYLVPHAGRIVMWGEAETLRRVTAKAQAPVETYGLTPECDWFAGDIEFSEGVTRFRIVHREAEIAAVAMPETGGVGRMNILNALGAAAVAHGRGVRGEDIALALATFRSPRRRMQVVAEVRGVTIVDDFAHHPTAIAETIAAARVRWPGRRVWAVVEPRSNTMRTKAFEAALPGVLAAADAVAIGPVHRPHLLTDDQRLSPSDVAAAVRAMGRVAAHYDSADAIVADLASQCRAGDVVLVMSNGSFDGLHHKLASALEARQGRKH